MIDAAAADVARARLNIEDWYNSSMDRVSGWYKRRSHIIVLLLGFGVDVLNKFIVVRSTVKPKEKSPEEKSKD